MYMADFDEMLKMAKMNGTYKIEIFRVTCHVEQHRFEWILTILSQAKKCSALDII